MHISFSTAAATALLAVAVADPLTVIHPCPGTNVTAIKPITVTEQYQPVSTCAPTSTCFRGSCTTKFPFATYAYVSTVIGAAWDGKQVQPTTVTATAQTVTVSRFQTTLTKWITPAPVRPASGTTTTPKPTAIELTIAKDFYVPYDKLGPLAIPGYEGSGLCKECEAQPDGSRAQVVGVVECRAGPGGSKCMGYEETWVSKPAPSTSATTANACATRFVAPSAGTYTFTFPFVAPARTITAADTTITVGPVPYWAHVTRVCHRPREVIDFTTTITKTIFWTAPCSRQPPTTSSTVAIPTGNHAFPGFPRPGRGNDADDGINQSHGDPYSWADWGSDDAADPSKPIPSGWADWVATASTATSTTSSVSRGPVGPSTTTGGPSSSTGGPGWSSTRGPSGHGTTTSELSSTSSSLSTSFSHGPFDSSSFSFSHGPGTWSSSSSSSLSQVTTTSTLTTSTSSFTHGPVDNPATTTSTITSFSTSVSVTTTSAVTSTTSLVAIPVDPSTFVIGVNAPTKYRKRALQYIQFSASGDAVLVTDKDEASLFSLVDGYLKFGALFVDADTSQSYLAFSLTAVLNDNIAKWTINADGTVSINAPVIGICVTADGSVFIQFSGTTPFTCNNVVLAAEVPTPTTSTTSTTTFAAPTATTTTTTTTSFDPSGDLDADIPAPTNVRRGVQYGGPRFGRRRH